jgi:hypothetical protein
MAGKLNTTILLAAGAIALGFAGVAASSAASVDARVIEVAAVPGDVDAVIRTPSLPIPDELAEYADAPDGVDAVVTGPVSTAFKQRQQAADCDAAIWPNIPRVCFPD